LRNPGWKGDRILDCARLLIESGAEVDAKDNHGRTILGAISEAEGFRFMLQEFASLLVESGANTETIDLSWMD
jgi:hypothetical protein